MLEIFSCEANMDNVLALTRNPRVTVRRDGTPDPDGTCVVYWMQRAQRGIDNPALDVAVEAANALRRPAVVFFAPRPFPPANLRHYAFLLQGIPDIAEALGRRDIGFVLRRFPDHSLLKFCDEVHPALVVGDENPLRQARGWRDTVTKRLRLPLWTVDADVIVPSKLLEKQQYAAFLIRPRLESRLKEFLIAPRNRKARVPWSKPRSLTTLGTRLELSELTSGWNIDRSVEPVAEWKGGARQALRLLRDFTDKRLANYLRDRNHPELEGTSRLSPYLHFGHISPITVALAVQKASVPESAKEAFLSQVITWRELSVNLVQFNPNYDNFECAEDWAHRTLAAHASDPRPVLYAETQLENAETHDPLWNAAQRQMVSTGWMHNYMRMYWGKKILEWTKSPAQAHQIAVRLNDKYEIDGRDANGYAGIAWSIVGKFDRPWFERPIFGQIRYMSGASTGKKFDSKKYVAQHSQTQLIAD
jgi:deoxyribodipyrimidine photo-lyase